MADFINTIDVLGDDAVIDSIIDRSIIEFKDDTLETVGQYAFYKCNALETVDLPAVTAIDQYAFNFCEGSLVNVSFPKATTIAGYAFQNCKKLISADFPSATSLGDNAFQQCTELTTANFPLVTSAKQNAFYGCRKLSSINFPSLAAIPNRMFQACESIKNADFPSVTEIGSYAFYGCIRLVALILRSETMRPLANANALDACCHFLGTSSYGENPNKLKDGYIYVPRALVDSYKAATNWSTYAAQFRALEDYTVDGTITGALDETKI